VIAIVFFFVFKNLCVHCITVKGLKLTFGIRAVIDFMRTHFWVGSVINLVIVGAL
jgi:hypothetical protein